MAYATKIYFDHKKKKYDSWFLMYLKRIYLYNTTYGKFCSIILNVKSGKFDNIRNVIKYKLNQNQYNSKFSKVYK